MSELLKKAIRDVLVEYHLCSNQELSAELIVAIIVLGKVYERENEDE